MSKDPLDLMIEEHVSVPDLARMLEVPRGNVYDRVKSGRLRSRRVGRAHLIPRREARHALEQEAKALREQAARIDAAVQRLSAR